MSYAKVPVCYARRPFTVKLGEPVDTNRTTEHSEILSAAARQARFIHRG